MYIYNIILLIFILTTNFVFAKSNGRDVRVATKPEILAARNCVPKLSTK